MLPSEVFLLVEIICYDQEAATHFCWNRVNFYWNQGTFLLQAIYWVASSSSHFLLKTFCFFAGTSFGFAATTHRSSFWAEMCFLLERDGAVRRRRCRAMMGGAYASCWKRCLDELHSARSGAGTTGDEEDVLRRRIGAAERGVERWRSD